MTTPPASIVMVDDDLLMRRSLGFLLTKAGYDVTAYGTAEAALTHLARESVDLVLLDIGLPGMDGLDALRGIQNHGDTPVIFVTARRRELEQVLGLELGADDYITKPFDPDVLLARMKAVLRRSRRAETAPNDEANDGLLHAGDITIDLAGHRVTRGGEVVELSPREFELLAALAREPERVLSVDDLLERVWGHGFAGEPQIVYVHIRRLRQKIEEDPATPRRIVTVRGVGYRFVVRAKGSI